MTTWHRPTLSRLPVFFWACGWHGRFMGLFVARIWVVDSAGHSGLRLWW